VAGYSVILADPTSDTRHHPVLLTVAIVLSEEDIEMLPRQLGAVLSNATAESCVVLPTSMFFSGALTVTAATVVTFGPWCYRRRTGQPLTTKKAGKRGKLREVRVFASLHLRALNLGVIEPQLAFNKRQ